MSVILFTGGSRGIGKKVIQKLSKDYHVLNLSRTKSRIFGVEDLQCDLSNSQDIKKIFSKIKKIDCLINNAAITKFSNNNFENFSRIIDINVKAVYYCSELSLKFLKKSKCPRIINISSINAELAFPKNPGYVCSKGGLNALTRSLALDYSKYGILVNSISPGYINDGMAKKSYLDLNLRRQRVNRMIIKRFGTPNDIYSTIKFLIDKGSSYITGADIKVDGGWTARGL